MRFVTTTGALAWLALSVAVAGALGQVAAPPGSKTIESGRVLVAFDESTGTLRMSSGPQPFAVARLTGPGALTCAVEKVHSDRAFGPGRVMKIAPGENRVLVRDGSPWVLIRRDARAAPATPGKRVEALQATLDLRVETARLKGLGPAGLFDPANNPGQHVVTAIADPATGAGVVAGLVRIDAASGVLLSKVDGGKVVLTLRNDYGSAVPPDLEPFGGDWWAVGWFADVRDGLESYADEFARLNAIKLKPVPVGFMTWYSEKYGGALNETAVIELSRYLAATFKEYGYGFVQIDDLWQNGQKRNGPAKDFSRVNPTGPYKGGMKPVADQIRSLGLTPGLWLLPFAIDHQDPLLAGQAPLVARKADGSPYETNWSGTALDLTRPEARAYVQGFIRRAVQEWGFGYLKLDGLHIGMATRQTYPERKYVEDHFGDAVFADKGKSNMQAGRMGLAAVREAAGPDTFILGCCVPQNERSLGMVMGLVDAMRVGADSGVNWGGVVEGVRSASALYFLNGRVWWSDPDAIYARAKMPLHEVQNFAGWVTLTGMLNNQTDWAPDYPADRVDLLRRTMPSHQLASVRPVDLLEHDPPRIWVLSYEIGGAKRKVIGLFNWTDQEIKIGASAQRLGLRPDATYAAFEFWSNRMIPPFSGGLRERVPARSSLVFVVREVVDHPILLGTSRHVTQGAIDVLEEAWNASQRTLSGAGRVVGRDPYELRILAFSGPDQTAPSQAAKAEVSPDDRAAGVTIALTQHAGLVRARILSPTSRTVRWSLSFAPAHAEQAPGRWTPQKAWDWHKARPWLVGCNFLPSTAVNDVEMWQKESFDPKTIDRELGWAHGLGFNSVRVFLNFVAWKDDPAGLKERLDEFLTIADRHRISVMPVLLDDCNFAGREAAAGRQGEPVPGVHNSQWVSSPPLKMVADRSAWPDIEKYVKDVVGRFGADKRVVVWDLYNEPGNSGMGTKSRPLLEAAFAWARQAKPAQPLTVAAWADFNDPVQRRMMELSDVISFHGYDAPPGVEAKLRVCGEHSRPVICTEWLHRGGGNTVQALLPVFRDRKVGCYHWGLVAGRTQTFMPWGSAPGTPVPKLWQHDLLHKDGTPFDPAEVQLLRRTTGVTPPGRRD